MKVASFFPDLSRPHLQKRCQTWDCRQHGTAPGVDVMKLFFSISLTAICLHLVGMPSSQKFD